MKLRLLAFLFLCSGLWAQTSNVTATITDPDSQTWNNGNVQVLFIPAPGIPPGQSTWSGGGTFPVKFTATMNGTGTFTVSIPDNNFITPHGSQWQFTLCSNTSAPCQNTLTTVTGASPNLSATLSSQIIAPRFGGGAFAYGYLDLEVINPTTGVQYFNVTSSVTRQWNGTAWQSSGGVGPGSNQAYSSADMSQFGVLGTTKWIGDGSITSGSAVMTCPNADCAFTSADIGKVCFASQLSANDGTILPIGTISVVTDASHATCNGGNATNTNTTTALIVWGPDDDAALNTADAATVAVCGQLKIHGMILIRSAKFKTIASTYAGCSTTNQYGSSGGTGHATVFGDGQTSTYLIPTPNFDFSTCTGNGNGTLRSCIGAGGTTVEEFRSFTIDGFYTAGLVAGRTASLSLFADSFIANDMTIFGWCGSGVCTSSVGCNFTNQATSAAFGGCQNVGLIACYSAAAQVFLGPNWSCEGTTNAYGMQVAATGSVKTINTFFSGSTNSVQVLATGQWLSDFDELGGGTTTPISNAGTIYMNRFNAINVTNNNWWPITNTATGKIFASNSNFNPASTNWINNATGAQFFDQGGNKFTGSAAGTCGVSCLNDSFSINQTACASGNFGFTSGWGTTAVTGTPTGNSQSCQFSIQTTVTGTAGPVLTYTFPQSFAGYGRTPNCTLSQVGGTFTLSNPSHAPTTTTDVITFAGTPTATQTYTFLEQCR